MKVAFVFIFALATGLGHVEAFLLTGRPAGRHSTRREVGYVPDGMNPQQWKKLQAKEKAAQSKKKFGAFGPQSFKSRSLQSFQTDMEKGKAGHLMPVFNAKDRIKRGELKQEDIPYMQRLGSWDNSDVKGAKKVSWNEIDRRYDSNQKPAGIDWMGVNQRRGGQASSGGKPPKQGDKTKTKKLFGLF